MAFQPIAFQPAYQQVQQDTGAGRGRRNRRRYFVQVDGQDFEVASPEDARQLLQQAVAIAERAAEKQVAKAATVQREPVKVAPVHVSIPEIRTNAPIDLEPYQRAIAQAYRNAAVAAELRMLLEAQARDDDDAAAYLLLH